MSCKGASGLLLGIARASRRRSCRPGCLSMRTARNQEGISTVYCCAHPIRRQTPMPSASPLYLFFTHLYLILCEVSARAQLPDIANSYHPELQVARVIDTLANFPLGWRYADARYMTELLRQHDRSHQEANNQASLRCTCSGQPCRTSG